MNHCWFCGHPGVRNIDPALAKRIQLSTVCEAHMDYEIFYKNEDHPMPVPMTPRMVLAMVRQIELENVARSN